MLIVQSITKSYGIETILDDVSFIVNPGDRVALVGVNGSGKSTLLDIIAGLIPSDKGSITIQGGARLGYLKQGLTPDPGATIADEVRSADLIDLQTRLDELGAALADPGDADLDALLEAYGEAQAKFEALGGYDLDHRIEHVLANLGLAGIDLDTPVAQLSGGQQTRVGLARVLIQQPDLLLLDEPTNHLDIAALEWLEAFLTAYQGAVLVVSHDRTFLDRTVTRVLALDEVEHTLSAYVGNYTDFEDAVAAARERQWQEYNQQQADIRRMQADIHTTKMHAMSVELTTKPNQPTIRRYAKKVAKKAKSREKKLDRYMESEDRVDKPDQRWNMKLDFGQPLRGGQNVLMLNEVGHRYDEGAWLFRDVTHTVRHGERIVLLGANGTGKSTLAQIMAGRITPAAGTIRLGANVQLGYMPQKQDTLDPSATPLSLIRDIAPISETEARNFLHFFLFGGDDVFLPIERLSYGERARLLLARLVIGGANTLLLDEPINHLDIPSRQRFEEALESFPGAIIAIAHDRAFIDRFATSVWTLDSGALRVTIDRDETV